MTTISSAPRSRKFALSAIAAITLIAVLTVVAAAAGNGARWEGTGVVLFIGPSGDPSAPTTTTSEFGFGARDRVRAVRIHTTNELVVGLLGDGFGGSAVTACEDRRDGAVCDRLDELLTNAQVTSFHNSLARLKNVTEHTIAVPGIGEVPVLSGNLRGNLEGAFTISDATGGTLSGTASLRIRPGSTGTYGCFLVTPEAFIPLTSLDTCINDTGGQIFPILLDVQDGGSFEVGNGTGSLSDIERLQGRVRVNAQANLLLADFGGTMGITHGRAKLVPHDEPES